MIRIASILIFAFVICNDVIAKTLDINDIQFVIDEDCLFQGYELTLEDEYVTYLWEDVSTNTNLGSSHSIIIQSSSEYCVTVTNDQGVSCNACVDIELSEMSSLEVNDNWAVCSGAIGNGIITIDFNSLIIEGPTNGIWIDTDASGVDLSNLEEVDFLAVLPGQYIFTYILNTNCYNETEEVVVDVIDCSCPILNLTLFEETCNSDFLNLADFTANNNGEWSSNDLEVNNNLLNLEGVIPGQYTLMFDWFDVVDWCPSVFETTIDVIGCFNANEVLMVNVDVDQLVFSWTNELDVLDIEIQVLQGPEGIRDGNTYTMSGMNLGEGGGIEIFVNTEGYQYDNDLIIYGITANTTSINWLEDSGNLLSVFPNPVDDILQLELSSINSPVKSIEIYTAAGILLSNDIKPLSNEINVSGLSTGLYFLMVNLENDKIQLPFIKN